MGKALDDKKINKQGFLPRRVMLSSTPTSMGFPFYQELLKRQAANDDQELELLDYPEDATKPARVVGKR